jgi:hypothetical protein
VTINKPVVIMQSNLSEKPPWPGIVSAKSLILNALFNPLARNPPNGATRLAKRLITVA